MASHHHHPKLYFAPMMAAASEHLGLGFADKRNRNPNWTDHEIIRFLEILQEEKVLKDLLAQRNKQVFCYVAQRMTTEGSEKTWDQCRIKLKNLKSQYRYVKDRIPNIDEVDLEDDEVLKQLISECQGRGISPSNIKHLRYLKRFLQKTADYSTGHHIKPMNSLPVDPIRHETSQQHRESLLPCASTSSTSATFEGNSRSLRFDRSPFMSSSHDESEHLVIDDAESVSPPHTPLSSGIRLIPDKEDPIDDFGNNSANSRKRKRSMISTSYLNGNGTGEGSNNNNNGGGGGITPFGDLSELLTGSMIDGYRFIEKFNRDMMDQFMEYQKRVTVSQNRWEAERRRQDQLAIEQWRQEAREHDRQMFTIFCSALTNCNAALNILLKAKEEPSSGNTNEENQSTIGGRTGKSAKSLDQSSHSSADDIKSPASSSKEDANCSS